MLGPHKAQEPLHLLLVSFGGGLDGLEQQIGRFGFPAHGRNHHCQALLLMLFVCGSWSTAVAVTATTGSFAVFVNPQLVFDDPCGTLVAIGTGDARPAEFMNLPRLSGKSRPGLIDVQRYILMVAATVADNGAVLLQEGGHFFFDFEMFRLYSPKIRGDRF